MEVEFLRRNQEVEGIWSFWFSRPRGFNYAAGDYTELSLERVVGNHRRWFSLASAPSESDLRITTWVDAQSSPFKQTLMNLKKGDTAHVAPPMGNFNAPPQPDKLLFIAAGIGVTPFRSLLVEQTHTPTGHDIILLYSARQNQHLFLSEIQRSKASFVQHTTAQKRLDLAEITQRISDIGERLIYLAGPEPMMTKFYEDLLTLGHPRWRLRLCYFPGYQSI